MSIYKYLIMLAVLSALGCNTATDSTPDTAAPSTPDTAAPTVSSVVASDASGTNSVTLSASPDGGLTFTTNSVPSDVPPVRFTITFSETMNASTVSTDNVTYDCITAETVSVASDTDGVENNEFLVTLPAGLVTPLDFCFLIIGVGVTDAAGNHLGQASIYAVEPAH